MKQKITSLLLALIMLLGVIAPNDITAQAAENYPLNSIVIKIEDAVTHSMLVGARFEIYYNNQAVSGGYGTLVATVDSDASGVIVISGLPSGYYIVRQTVPPNNYHLSIQNEQHCYIKPDGTSIEELVFSNYRYGGLVVILNDKDTGGPVANATFSVTDVNNKAVGPAANGEYMTDSRGEFYLENLPAGDYKITQLTAAQGYAMDSSPNVRTVRLQHTNADQSVFRAVFENSPLGSLLVRVKDSQSKEPLAGAVFNVKLSGGADLGEFTSSAEGTFLLPKIARGTYIISQVSAPAGYLTATAKTQYVNYINTYAVDFENSPQSGLFIVKVDADTKAPLKDAKFNIYRDATLLGIYTTNADGAITIPNLESGWYTVSEYASPAGYVLDDTPQSVQVTSGQLHKLAFENKKLASLQIIKTDAYSHAPLSGATFTVQRANGERIGIYKTDVSGKIIVPVLEAGTYIVSETIAPEGYILDNIPQTVVIKNNALTVAEFTNKPLSGIEILKTGVDGTTPLIGAVFTIVRANGERVGDKYTTDVAGKIVVHGLAEGVYIVSEIQAPVGYLLNSPPQTVEVKSGRLTIAEFTNKELPNLYIRKTDADTGALLAGAEFTVERNGVFIAHVVSSSSSAVIVPRVQPGIYTITEVKAPAGYELNDPVRTVEVTATGDVYHNSAALSGNTVTFGNKKLNSLVIVKLDAVTHAPLSGATFTVERDNGEKIGTYKTDASGKIIVPDLSEGTYIVSETIAPDGYTRDEAPKTVIVKSGKITTVEFTNKPLSGLKILKLDSVSRSPIEGVIFTVSKMSGETVTNEFNGTTFKTDKSGQIFIPQLADGYYIVTETGAASGYILDGEPKTVQVQSGKTTLLEVLNTPQSGLLIVKTDKNTGRPLAGVVFDVRRADGQFVAGSILDGNQPGSEANSPNRTTSPNGDITGSYTTDANGRILINGLAAGQYHVTERKALDGYELDTDVHSATVVPGKLTTLQLTNTPKAGLRILKIDSVTKQPIYGVEFMLFDSNNKVVGTYRTDNNGVIDFTGIIPEGRYTIRETKAAAGYYLDEIPKTVEFTSGKVTEIRWENTPQMAQIQITKKSGDDNEVNGLPAGTPLAGAVFEAYDYRTGNLVDRFVSGSDGRAVSKALPLGRYTVKEVQAPQWYKLSDRVLDIDLEFATQIVKMEYLNYAANTGVSIKKTGNIEAMPGDVIPYTIREIRNTSTVPLTDFYWRDVLPVDAVRLTRIVTGTYNQSLRYKIIATTNKGDTRVIADNLSTTQNNVIDCSGASLGLRSDEFVTSFTLVFGTVRAGFCQVEQPQVFVKVQPNLPNGYQFANKCDVAGKYGKEWVAGNSTALTTIYAKPGTLPRTGY